MRDSITLDTIAPLKWARVYSLAIAVLSVSASVGSAQTQVHIQQSEGHVSDSLAATTVMADIAVSRDRIVMVDNLYVGLRSNDGRALHKVGLGDFFRSINPDGQGISYTRAIFDQDSRRFF